MVKFIKRASSEQWYVNFPAAVAQAIEFNKGEKVEWLIDDHQNLVLHKSDKVVASLKKTESKNENFTLLHSFTRLLNSSTAHLKTISQSGT